MTAAVNGTTQEHRYSSREVAELTGVTYRQLQYWTSLGHVRATTASLGSGYPHTYSLQELMAVHCMRSLIDFGFRVDLAARIARQGYRDA